MQSRAGVFPRRPAHLLYECRFRTAYGAGGNRRKARTRRCPQCSPGGGGRPPPYLHYRAVHVHTSPSRVTYQPPIELVGTDGLKTRRYEDVRWPYPGTARFGKMYAGPLRRAPLSAPRAKTRIGGEWYDRTRTGEKQVSPGVGQSIAGTHGTRGVLHRRGGQMPGDAAPGTALPRRARPGAHGPGSGRERTPGRASLRRRGGHLRRGDRQGGRHREDSRGEAVRGAGAVAGQRLGRATRPTGRGGRGLRRGPHPEGVGRPAAAEQHGQGAVHRLQRAGRVPPWHRRVAG